MIKMVYQQDTKDQRGSRSQSPTQHIRGIDTLIKRDTVGARRFKDDSDLVDYGDFISLENLKEILEKPPTITEFIDDFAYLGGITDLYAYTYLFTLGTPGKWLFVKKDIAFKAVEQVKEVHGDDGLLYEVTVSDSAILRATNRCKKVLNEYLKGKEDK